MASSIHLHFAGGGLCSLSLPSITKHFELEAGESQGLTARRGLGGGEVGCFGLRRTSSLSFPLPRMHTHSRSHIRTPSPTHHYTQTHVFVCFFFLSDCPFNHLVAGKVYNRHSVDPVSNETSLLSCLMESSPNTTKPTTLDQELLKRHECQQDGGKKCHPCQENIDTHRLTVISAFH